MSTLNDYFDKIFLINLSRRVDRLAESMVEVERLGIKVERFEGHDMQGQGNDGCTASHRGVLELICHHKWPRTLILEDDFKVRHDDCNEQFAAMIGEVPADWDMLYLGGHYAEPPRERISPHVIRMGHMKTTSSYAVTYDSARKIAPHIYGSGPIDELYLQWHQKLNCYIFQPRLMVQRESFSDIQQHVCANEGCMIDTRHENMV